MNKKSLVMLLCAIVLASFCKLDVKAVSSSSSDGHTTVTGSYTNTASGISATSIGTNKTSTTYSMLVTVKTSSSSNGNKTIAGSRQDSVAGGKSLSTGLVSVNNYIWCYSTLYGTTTSKASVRVR